MLLSNRTSGKANHRTVQLSGSKEKTWKVQGWLWDGEHWVCLSRIVKLGISASSAETWESERERERHVFTNQHNSRSAFWALLHSRRNPSASKISSYFLLSTCTKGALWVPATTLYSDSSAAAPKMHYIVVIMVLDTLNLTFNFFLGVLIAEVVASAREFFYRRLCSRKHNYVLTVFLPNLIVSGLHLSSPGNEKENAFF